MPNRKTKPSPAVKVLAGLLLALPGAGCFGQSGEAAPDPAAERARVVRDPAGRLLGVEPPAPAPQQLPALGGPFVEPPLLERPARLYQAVIDCRPNLDGLLDSLARTRSLSFLPVGYPAPDQAPVVTADCRWLLLAGKFARRAYAERLVEALQGAGLGRARVQAVAYRHDRFMPSANHDARRPGVGTVFAGVAGQPVPLLQAPRADAAGRAQLADGETVRVDERVAGEAGSWFRVSSAGGAGGYLPARRLLFGHNVYPAADGRRAVLAVGLGCTTDGCLADYWLVSSGYRERLLLGSRLARLRHAFAPAGGILAYAVPGRPLYLIDATGQQRSLGPGTSPSWAPDGRRLYFRRPGRAGLRDQVVFAEPPEWQVRELFDLPGTPLYPRRLSAFPPPVDVLEGGAKLYTMFYRLLVKDGGRQLVRWKVVIGPQGRLLSKKGEQLTE